MGTAHLDLWLSQKQCTSKKNPYIAFTTKTPHLLRQRHAFIEDTAFFMGLLLYGDQAPRASQQPPQGWVMPSRVWLFWLGSFKHRCTAVVVNARGRARMFGFGPTIFFFASSSASSNVARVLSPMPRAMPGSRAPTM